MRLRAREIAAKVWRWMWLPLLMFILAFLVLALLVQFTFPGLGPNSAGYRTSIPMIRVPAHGSVVVEFESFCLDHHRGCPRGGSAYSLMEKTAGQLRPYMGQIFEEYLGHPTRWVQGDVQAAIWYCEGETHWASLTPTQQKLIETATGKTDPARKHPLILINTLYERLSPRRLLESAIGLMMGVMFAAFLATRHPSGLITSLLEWAGAPDRAQQLRSHRYAKRADHWANLPGLGLVRNQLDNLWQSLCARVCAWRRQKGGRT